ncbi:MAG TPA: beta-N-acetylhexosaminidase [Symbiobacteriaceae bacterium]|nr:beta-N-acetylhexosaminidase [Symbiobacteriaceae bacterium]
MDLTAFAGQLVMAGFQGTALPSDFARQVEEDGLSGIILFSRNLSGPAQIRRLTDQLQALTPDGLPMLIATDQEGGIVARLSGIAGTDFPGNMALGAAHSPELAHAAALAAGRELLALGINMNLAPVLDVNNNPQNPVIGVRSYGEDPHLVAELGAAAIRGYQEAGVLACGKHFPGHGDTAVDSHLALPTVAHDRVRLDEVELVPFRAAVAAGVGAIMTAHVVFPAYEPDPARPATLSRPVLTGLLRDRLTFDGLVITDCMEMKAIANGFGTVAAVVEAVKAGADLVLVSHTAQTQRAAVAALKAAIASGEIPAERVEQALGRIRRARERAAGVQQPSLALLAAPDHTALADRIAAAAVTVVKDEPKLLPLPATGLGVVVCRAAAQSLAEEQSIPEPAFAAAVRKLLPGAELLVADRAPTPGQIAAAGALAARSHAVVVATFGAAQWPAQAELVAAVLAANPRTAVVAQRSPYDLRVLPPAVGTYLAIYEDRPRVAEAAVRILLGQHVASGRLPVTV